MQCEWAEELPEKCPPDDAYPPQNEIFYRLGNNPPVEADFNSVRLIDPQRSLNADECHAKACSLFARPELMRRIMKLRPFRNKSIIRLTLTPESGLIQSSFSDGHYSWWRRTSFDCLTHCDLP